MQNVLKKLKFDYQFENYCFKLYLRQDFRVHTLLHYSCLIAFDDLLSHKHFLKATINTSDSVEDRYTQILEFCIFSFLLARLFSLQFQSTFCKTILKEGKIKLLQSVSTISTKAVVKAEIKTK